MLKRFALALPFIAATAFPAAADPVEDHLSQQWTASQVMLGNLTAAMDRVLQDRRMMQMRIAELERLCGDPCKAEPQAPGVPNAKNGATAPAAPAPAQAPAKAPAKPAPTP
ncbi:MAG: hypothetical protein AB7H90_01440 [Alphaproteobacteria bacterium]